MVEEVLLAEYGSKLCEFRFLKLFGLLRKLFKVGNFLARGYRLVIARQTPRLASNSRSSRTSCLGPLSDRSGSLNSQGAGSQWP
jgi:hypothetical protein